MKIHKQSGIWDPPRLVRMPTEVILSIVDVLFEEYPMGAYSEEEITPGYSRSSCTKFCGVRWALRLGATCKQLYRIVSPYVFKHDIRFDYSSALILSTRNGRLDGVAKSLSCGADVNTPDGTLFDEECDSTREYGCDWWVSRPIYSSMTALHWAAFYGNLDAVHFLLEHGADIHQRADLGYATWFEEDWNGENGYWEDDSIDEYHPLRAIFCVVDQEWDDYKRVSWRRRLSEAHPLPLGANALFFALKGSQKHHQHRYQNWTDKEHFIGTVVPDDESGCRLAIAKTLIAAGSSLVTRESSPMASGISIHTMHQACAYGEFEIASFLVDTGVDPNLRDQFGWTPLHHVANNRGVPENRRKKTWMTLLSKGADVTLKDSSGLTPVDRWKKKDI